MRVLFALPGLHRVQRGAEVAFEAVAHELALSGRDEVHLFGSGQPRADRAYRFHHVPALPREYFERMPTGPLLRSEYAYEELSFAAPLWWATRRTPVDLTVTCGYPYTSWILRSHGAGPSRPAHIFVTQNGDWPARSTQSEYRFFSCDGLVCTNPMFFAENQSRWPCALIPNGVDPARFRPGPASCAALGLPAGGKLVLIASALIALKRVLEGIEAVAQVPEASLVVAGDGPLRDAVEHAGRARLPGRFLRRAFSHDQMPELYRCADVLLHPTLQESFGNVYVEALATGLPVVAHDTHQTRWIFEDQAVLVDATRTDALAAGLRSVLARASDVEAQAARRRFAVQRYAWRTIANQYRRFFEQVCRQHAHRSTPSPSPDSRPLGTPPAHTRGGLFVEREVAP